MSAGQPTEAEVLQAIEASGFLLEQKVASLLENLGFNVTSNAAYQDYDEGKSREIDVLAYRQLYRDDQLRLTVGLEIICECKNTTNPFVFIGRNKPPTQRRLDRPEFIFPLPEYHIPVANNPSWHHVVSGFDRFGVANLHYYHNLSTQTVQFCRLLRKKVWEVDQGGVYDSLVYPVAKAVLARRSMLTRRRQGRRSEHDWSNIGVIVPLIIHAGEIFYLDSSASDPVPQQVTHATYERHLQAKNVSGTFTIDFVSLSGLDAFVTQKLNPFSERLVALVQEEGEALFHQ